MLQEKNINIEKYEILTQVLSLGQLQDGLNVTTPLNSTSILPGNSMGQTIWQKLFNLF